MNNIAMGDAILFKDNIGEWYVDIVEFVDGDEIWTVLSGAVLSTKQIIEYNNLTKTKALIRNYNINKESLDKYTKHIEESYI